MITTIASACSPNMRGSTQPSTITYPTHDLLKGLTAIGPDQGRPVVTIGERGAGKSHIMGALYHAVTDPSSTEAWLQNWSTRLQDPEIGSIPLRDNTHVIGVSLQRQLYKFLWDVLFDEHPYGEYIKGKWDGFGADQTDVPSHRLMLELFEHTPTMLLFDEFQTWFEGLRNTKEEPARKLGVQLRSDPCRNRKGTPRASGARGVSPKWDDRRLSADS